MYIVKIFLGLKWVILICNLKYILKVNLDLFVNVYEMIKWLYLLGDNSEVDFKYKKGLYMGYCYGGVRLVRNFLSVYFILED